jgi:hypothetical protein
MKILDKAAKLEKALLERLARRADVPRHPIELYRAILDDIEDASEPGARGGKIFPYTQVTVSIPTVDAHQRATAEAVFSEPPALEERARTRLRQAGCTNADALTVVVKFVDGASAEWAGREYSVAFARSAPRPSRRMTASAQRHELLLVVVSGAANGSRFVFTEPRINLGRLAQVVDRQQRVVRSNHVAFADNDDLNQSVSRTHAHIRFDARSGEARVHDDGSTYGTRVVRGGRTLEVPRGGRGVTLKHADEVLLGQARVRVFVRVAKDAPASRQRKAH